VALPEVTFTVTCSKGAYIRTLAADLGERLGCGAYLKALQRLRVGPFSLDRALSLPEPASPQSAPELLGHLIPMAACLPHLPTLPVDGQSAVRVRQGRALPLDETLGLTAPVGPGEHVKIVWQEQLVAVAVLDEQAEKIRPLRVFNP
jgi:tRNA pseudouridine55 synthase